MILGLVLLLASREREAGSATSTPVAPVEVPTVHRPEATVRSPERSSPEAPVEPEAAAALPATEEGVREVIRGNPEMVATCFAVLGEAPAEVVLLGRIGSLAQHGSGPRGFVDELDVELPGEELAGTSASHCFEALVNPRAYETPRTGPVAFEITVKRP